MNAAGIAGPARLARRCGALALALLVAACGGGGGGEGNPPAADQPAAAQPPAGPPANPPAAPAAPSRVVLRQAMDERAEPTTLRADLPDASRVELYLPKYSVREDAEITIAALPASLKLPTGSVAGGVRLEPDGLKLGNSATLTLQVKGTLDPRTTLGFAIHAGKVTYHPVTLRHEDVGGVAMTRVDIPLLGFSDHGIVSNADPAVIAAAITLTTPPLDALSAQLTGVANAVEAIELLRLFFEMRVKPALENAATLTNDPVQLETAMRLYLAWRDQLAVMDELFPAVDNATIDPDALNALLTDAILFNMRHWNDRCSSSLEPADARKVVTAWLWAPAVFLDRNAPLRKSDLQTTLCMQMEILGTDLDALLESDQARPLVIRTGLKVLTQPHRHDVPVKVRAAQVMGGSATAGSVLADAAGAATLSVTANATDPGVALEINASVSGFADVLDRTVRVFRPRNGGQPRLIVGKKFVGSVRYYFDRTPPECRQGREPGLEFIGEVPAALYIAGDPFAYVVSLKELEPVGGPVPPPADWVAPLMEFHGRGDFQRFSGLIFSIESGGGVQRVTDPYGYLIAGIGMDFSVTGDDAQRLTGRYGRSCQHRELSLRPALPGE
jgi:hypothetical protein